MIIQIDLEDNELALLIHILSERIYLAQDEGVPEDHSSSIFRRKLMEKLLALKKYYPAPKPIYVEYKEKIVSIVNWVDNMNGTYKVSLSDGRTLDNLNLNQLRSLCVSQVLHGCVDVPNYKRKEEMKNEQ